MIFAKECPPSIHGSHPSIFATCFEDEGFQPPPRIRLTNEEYGRGLQRFIPPCADIVPVDPVRRVFYLACRKQKPNPSWWWIGGGILPGIPIEQSAVQGFKRETGVEFSSNRLTRVAVIDYKWSSRAQEPQDMGCHMIGYTYTVVLTPEELDLASRQLEPNEYRADLGFEAFDRDRLAELTEAHEIHPALLAVYDHVFSPLAQPEFGQLKALAGFQLAAALKTGTATTLIRELTMMPPPQADDEMAYGFDEIIIVLKGGVRLTLIETDARAQPIGDPIARRLRGNEVVNIPARFKRLARLERRSRALSISQGLPPK